MADLTYDNYPFLAELGIQKNNAGCYNGEWFGGGETIKSINCLRISKFLDGFVVSFGWLFFF